MDNGGDGGGGDNKEKKGRLIFGVLIRLAFRLVLYLHFLIY